MAEGRSSRRARKAVDYTQFGGGDEDFDDDFQDMTPPAKKQKVVKEPKPKTKKEKKETRPKKERKTVDDEMYERELELVLELSKNESASTDKDENHGVDPEMPKLEPMPKASPKKKSPKKKVQDESIKENNSPTDTDTIEVLEEDVQDETPGGSRSKRRAATKAKKKMIESDEEDENEKVIAGKDSDNEDEFKAEESSEEEAEEEPVALEDDSDGDSDFEGHWSKTKKKPGRGRGRGRGSRGGHNQTTPKVKPRLSATVYPVNKGRGKPLSRTPRAEHSPSPSSVRSIAGGSGGDSGGLSIRKPNWCPPGAAGSARSPLGGVNVKSPGAIRLGLSKKSKVKPLHGAVKVP